MDVHNDPFRNIQMQGTFGIWRGINIMTSSEIVGFSKVEHRLAKIDE